MIKLPRLFSKKPNQTQRAIDLTTTAGEPCSWEEQTASWRGLMFDLATLAHEHSTPKSEYDIVTAELLEKLAEKPEREAELIAIADECWQQAENAHSNQKPFRPENN